MGLFTFLTSKNRQLFKAVDNQDSDKVKRLIGAGVEVDSKDSRDRTALLLAAYYGDYETASYLCEKGADINFTHSQAGVSILEAAIPGGNVELVKLLINMGADINRQNKYGETPIYVAAAYSPTDDDRFKIVELLINNSANINAQKNDGWSPLSSAVKHGHTRIVGALINAGADVDIRTKDGGTPIIFASISNHADIMKLLITEGVSLDAATHEERGTALSFACIYGYEQCVDLLLNASCSVDVCDIDNQTPLMHAVAYACTYGGKSTALIRQLIKAGADINHRNALGSTALIIASEAGNSRVVRTLIQNTADTGIKNNKGMTALDVARAGNHKSVIEILEK